MWVKVLGVQVNNNLRFRRVNITNLQQSRDRSPLDPSSKSIISFVDVVTANVVGEVRSYPESSCTPDRNQLVFPTIGLFQVYYQAAITGVTEPDSDCIFPIQSHQ